MIPYTALFDSDLIVDAVYEGGGSVGALGDPISRLLPGCGNLGGFRPAGKGPNKKFVVLYTSGEDKDWPDRIDISTGMFTYYGDNKTPGHELHDTPKGGNRILKNVFECLHGNPSNLKPIPPFFVFAKYPTPKSSRSVQFKGLAVPGFLGITANDDLVAVWKTTEGQRFQNYRAFFTILDIPKMDRKWIDDLIAGKDGSLYAPNAWVAWQSKGAYKPLVSERTIVIRTVADQSLKIVSQQRILKVVFDYFKNSPKTFEAFAAKIFQLQDSKAIIDEITRGAVDGGRDAIGRYSLGLKDDPVFVDFALEAKCYRPPLENQKANRVGVKEVSRLISRLRHRQFGVLVTTSVVAKQAYEEVRDDGHPVIFICGKDIVEILFDKGFNTPESVLRLLKSEFPVR